jgi:hypothetical protein
MDIRIAYISGTHWPIGKESAHGTFCIACLLEEPASGKNRNKRSRVFISQPHAAKMDLLPQAVVQADRSRVRTGVNWCCNLPSTSRPNLHSFNTSSDINRETEKPRLATCEESADASSDGRPGKLGLVT